MRPEAAYGRRSEEYLGEEIGRRTGVAAGAVANRIWRYDMAIWDAELKPQSIARHRALCEVATPAVSPRASRSHS